MKQLILIAFFIFVSILCVSAQNSEKRCPFVEIIGPQSSVTSGEAITFALRFEVGVNTDTLKFLWQIDIGKIISGQGTNQIIIDTTGLSNEMIKAAVEIDGLPERCGKNFAETGIVQEYQHIQDWDDFDNIADDDVRARVDAFFIELQNNPNTLGIVLSFGSRKDIRKREKLIRNHIKFRKYDEQRIIFKYGGKEKGIRTRLYGVPEGTDISEIK